MYSLGSFPAVTRRKGSTIVVDIREVSLDCLRRLDQIEGVETPIGKADNDMYHDWYHREYVEVDGESVMLYAMYFEQVQDSDLIQNGDWINFINGRVDRRYTLD
jgi:gamma-glutamylcyclotransferase (GGCT)/AIG2-like uncharacterized protein YtfP